MAITPTQRHTHEWFLLILALAIVGAICVPLWQWSGRTEEELLNLTPQRLGRLLLGPEQIACYVCFAWASFILINRYMEVQRQRRAFKLDLLPTEEGVRILPEDSRPLLRKVEEINNRLRKIRFKATAGQHELTVTFLQRSFAESDERIRTVAGVKRCR